MEKLNVKKLAQKQQSLYMSIKLNKRVDLLRVGDKVITDMHEDEVVRTITAIRKDKQYGSGYVASVDGGEPCKCCGSTKGKPIENVDAAWFNVLTTKIDTR